MNQIKEVIVVEGRDDTRAIKRAVNAQTIETHGFGISRETIFLIEKAYKDVGIIIFTDPDHAGENIRKRLNLIFPRAKHAYLTRKDAMKDRDIGIENASAESILEALKKARATQIILNKKFCKDDLIDNGLIGLQDSRLRRQLLGKILGIGYSNGKGLLEKLNGFSIDKRDFFVALKKIEEDIGEI